MIVFNGVRKMFDGSEISYGDFVFENNKSYLVIGASGSGKTTMLNMIAGVTSPNGGEILIDGVDITKSTQSEKDSIRTYKIGYVYQDFKLIEDMSVEDNIRILEMCGIKSQDFRAVVSDLGLSDKLKRKVRTLSGGEKQRVAIARAIVKKPEIILADEPTGSLNYEIGDGIVKKLIACSKGKINITVSHDTRLTGYFDCVIDLTSKGDIENA